MARLFAEGELPVNLHCEIPEENPPSEEIAAILDRSRTVAVVGLSPKAERDSHRVAKYLQEQGYHVVPVNPGQREILGEKCYPNLREIPFPIDVVDVFPGWSGCNWALCITRRPGRPGMPACALSWVDVSRRNICRFTEKGSDLYGWRPFGVGGENRPGIDARPTLMERK